MNTRNRIALLATALSAALLPFAASAADLPKPQALFDAHIKAIGGRKAVEQDTDGTAKGTIEFVENGMKANLLMASRGKDRVMVMSIANAGEFRSGLSNDVAWSMDPMGGPRLLEGNERAQQAEMYDPKVTLRDASLIESATTTALSDSEGRPCYRVEIVWKSGKKTADCYSVEDGLLLSNESSIATPMGEVKQVSHMSDYQSQGPMKVARLITVKAAGMTQKMHLETYDAATPTDEIMAVPAAIQALIQKAQAANGTKASQSQ